MANFESTIEALEHQWMRAWIQRDRKAMKALAARDFIFLFGSEKATILDRPSWLEAAGSRFVCESYRFGSIYVRRHGNLAVFGSDLTIEASLDGHAWNGSIWTVDLWKRSGMRQRWKLRERTVSRPESDPDLPAALRSMQLWR